MFFDDDFGFRLKLEELWEPIRDEALALDRGLFAPWPNDGAYVGGWYVFPFISGGRSVLRHRRLCPVTSSVLDEISGLENAGFSVLMPATYIGPHAVHTWVLLRCHLGLLIPQDSAIRVGGETRTWAEGKTLVFDDAVEHDAWNRGDAAKLILLLDFKKPDHLIEVGSESAAAEAKAVGRDFLHRHFKEWFEDGPPAENAGSPPSPRE